MPIAAIADTTQGLKPALEVIFAPHGGVEAVIPSENKDGGGTVYVKPNGIHFTPHTHNDLMTNTRYQARLMGVTPVRMVPLNPLHAAWTLFQARLCHLTARVPPLLG
jgi:hypothetical protein